MKTIKFRAWHKEWSPKESEYVGRKINGIQFVKGIWWGNSGKGHVHLNEWSNDCPIEDVILMQYTHSLDKNDKEIYEGDILKVGNFLRVVEWDFDKFNARWTIESQEEIHQEQGLGMPPGGGIHEVIGNIYENPNLLNP